MLRVVSLTNLQAYEARQLGTTNTFSKKLSRKIRHLIESQEPNFGINSMQDIFALYLRKKWPLNQKFDFQGFVMVVLDHMVLKLGSVKTESLQKSVKFMY